MKKLFCAGLVWVLASSAFAAQSFSSRQGKDLVARFYVGSGNDLREVTAATRAVNTIDLCGAEDVESAELWMPEHDHGSAPTSLRVLTNGCTRVSNVQFIMRGAWEIRYRFADGDRATQEVNVSR